jgi:DNA-binding transcriptional MocR family regulator
MTEFSALAPQELQGLKANLMKRYTVICDRRLSLDITRGKPSPEQLDLSNGLLENVSADNFRSLQGTDCRNYGGLDGLPEARKLFADYMGVTPEEIIIGGNSSLNLMYDTFLRAMLHGVSNDATPWCRQPTLKFICPSPGYDRHFSICEHLGIEMIPVAMTDDGPDMDAVEALVAQDAAIKGIWCVPLYSNPTGAVYSDNTVDRLAQMTTRAADFRIFWDNAYAVHYFGERPDRLRNILDACKTAGHPDRPLLFGSTSKITFPGAGLAMIAGSTANMAWVRSQMFFQTIGPDKINQLRHVHYFGDLAGIHRHMDKHAAIVRPRFQAVQEILTRELEGKGIASWTRPRGGYFVSFDAPDGCARAVVQMAAEAGVKLTPAGSTYPLKTDPRDNNIRIAPTFASVDDVRTAVEVLAICTQIVTIDQFLT